MNTKQIKNMGYIALGLGLIIFAHHYAVHNYLFDWADINNHETLGLVCLSFALPILLIRRS